MAGAVRARDELCCWVTSCQMLQACQLTVCLGEGGQLLTSQRKDKDQTAKFQAMRRKFGVFPCGKLTVVTMKIIRVNGFRVKNLHKIILMQ